MLGVTCSVSHPAHPSAFFSHLSIPGREVAQINIFEFPNSSMHPSLHILCKHLAGFPSDIGPAAKRYYVDSKKTFTKINSTSTRRLLWSEKIVQELEIEHIGSLYSWYICFQLSIRAIGNWKGDNHQELFACVACVASINRVAFRQGLRRRIRSKCG